jgi:F-type H+-transporting ATPase subunit gamma
MASGKEIRTKIKSVENTKKITKAMEMVAAAKMRRSQERMKATRPYAEKVRDLAARLIQSQSEYEHPYLQAINPDVKKVGVVVVSSDKGLCGGLNSNLFRLLVAKINTWAQEGISTECVAIGNKGNGFLGRMGVDVIASVIGMGDKPQLEKILGALKVMVDRYVAGEVNSVQLCFNAFVNTMKQQPTVVQLLPLAPSLNETQVASLNWDYIYEPTPHAVINVLLKRYIESLVIQAISENIASEQSARMVAMKAASDNAGTVISQLKLVYNKTRQAAITKELSEIVSGAAAIAS